MLFDSKINITFGEMLSEIDLPKMYRIRQQYDSTHIEDVSTAVHREMDRFLHTQAIRGKRVAITIGSRGITFYAEIVRALIDSFRSHGALPFLITSMGSHGGATSEGQIEMARHLGICAEELGVEMRSSMDAREVGRLPDGTKVYCAADALDADAIFLLNKIKPHADFKGQNESGLVKMSVIGLGKHIGCSSIHKLGFSRFAEVLPQACQIVLEKAPVIGGLAIVENSHDMPFLIEAVSKENLIKRDRELLVLAKQNIARIHASSLDILIIDEVGKNVSGEGMDPNVTGRPGSELKAGFDFIQIGCIIVRGVTQISDGNGVGIGMADITTVRCAQSLNLGPMYTNSITAGILGPSRLPVVLNNDFEAMKVAIRVSAGDHLKAPRICWIRNTLALEEMVASEALAQEMLQREDVSLIGEETLQFDRDNYLISPFQ